MSKKQVTLAKKLIRIAHANPDKQAELVPKIKTLLSITDGGCAPKVAALDESKLTRQQRWDLKEARDLARSGDKVAADALALMEMPGFSPMQLRQQIDRLGTIRQEMALLSKQFEDVLAKIKGLEKEEDEGMKALKKAAASMREKGKYVAEAESAMISFTAYLTDKRPGIEQMIARPEDSKWGEKAGDFFGRVAAKFGNETAEAVESIYEATKEDLTHVTMAVRGLKLIQKTSSMDASTLKTAGLMDMVIDVKEWLAGKAMALFNFIGDVGRWLKGFVERTKVVNKSKDDLKKAVSSAQSQVDKLLAGAL